jgi:hypothetical protein
MVLAPAARRCTVCGEAAPEWAGVCGNCLSVLPSSEVIAPERETSPEAPLKRCAACGEESPIWARFCGACRQPFALPTDDPGEITQAGEVAEVSGVTDTLALPRVTNRLMSGAPASAPAAFAEALNAPTLAPKPALLNAAISPWQHTSDIPTLEQPSQPGPRQKPTRTRLKIIAALLVTALVVTSGGATLAYFLTRPEPVLQVMSAYFVGKTPAGSPSTTLRISGQHFSHASSVTILLDGKAAPGSYSVPTDGAGDFSVDLTVTEAWRYGLHTLTATDARGYTTQSGVQVDIIPRPVITMQSHYHQGDVPAGSASTTFHISGKWFSYQSPITFLLDGQPVPGSQGARSDAQGQVEADLTVSGDWRLGNHILTAKDAQGYTTQSGMPLVVVPQGEANTPGPNGAPADDASFMLVVTIQTQNPVSDETTLMQETLVVSGHADPAGGTVCQAHDNGQPYTLTGTVMDASGAPTDVTYQETLTSTCSGSYKGGRLTYTETVTTDQYVLSNGLICQAATPYTLQTLSGSFSAPTTSAGNWSTAGYTINCDLGLTFNQHPAQQGSWSGATQ